jgi:hypothetical protein
MGNEKLDEVALNCLLLSDVPPLTAVAASIVDAEPQPATYNYRLSIDLGLVVGLVVFVLWLL